MYTLKTGPLHNTYDVAFTENALYYVNNNSLHKYKDQQIQWSHPIQPGVRNHARGIHFHEQLAVGHNERITLLDDATGILIYTLDDLLILSPRDRNQPIRHKLLAGRFCSFLRQYDLNTQRMDWQIPYPCAGMEHFGKDAIYVMGYEQPGFLYAISYQDGSILWAVDYREHLEKDQAYRVIIEHNGILWIEMKSQRILLVESASGIFVKLIEQNDLSLSAMVPDYDKQRLIGFSKGKYREIDLATTAVTVRNLGEHFHQTPLGMQPGRFVVDEHYLYFLHYHPYAVAVMDRKTYEVVWQYEFTGHGKVPNDIFFCGKELVVISEAFTMYIFEPVN